MIVVGQEKRQASSMDDSSAPKHSVSGTSANFGSSYRPGQSDGGTSSCDGSGMEWLALWIWQIYVAWNGDAVL